MKKGEIMSIEQKEKIKNSNLGVKRTLDTKKRMSLSKIGKISNRKGKKSSLETKEKNRQANLGKKKSVQTRLKLSLSLKGRSTKAWTKKGKESHRWIKDRTQLKKSENKTKNVQYMYWSLNVKKRDVFKCRLLNTDCSGRLESHHIFNWVDYPELRYLLTNGITLCQFHHPRGRGEEKRMVPIFQELLSVSKE